MSWITVIWSMAASACLTLALIHGFIWFHQRGALANLLFAVTAVGAAAIAVCELIMMRARTPAEFGATLRWAHVPVWVVIVSLAWFVRLYLRAGRPTLGWAACVLRTLSLIPDFTSGTNLNYSKILHLRHIQLFGESVSVADGVLNPWMMVGQISLLLIVIYVAEAAVTVWYQGDRRRALVGASIVFLLLAGALEAAAASWGILNWPITVSLFYLGFVTAMAYQLSSDAIRAPQLARQLHESEQRMIQAADAANLGFWSLDLVPDEIWATNRWRGFFGFVESEPLDFKRFLQQLHPDDRESLRNTLAKAVADRASYETEYRALLPDGGVRWIASRGAIECNSHGKPVRLRSVSLDITPRKEAELEAQMHRNELAHLLRVASLGELSAALAHELNQPLTAILSNAQAAQRFLAQDSSDPEEIGDILRDIVADNQRATEVIQRLRTLLKKGEFRPQALDVNDVVLDVLKLMNTDLTARTVSVMTKFAPGLPPIRGDRVQLQQVLINLLLNAGDAMCRSSTSARTLTLQSSRGSGDAIEISIADTGGGFPPGHEEKIFEPYHTTKAEGLGLGLSLSRSILVAHGGRLWAETHAGSGATFHLTLHAWKGDAA